MPYMRILGVYRTEFVVAIGLKGFLEFEQNQEVTV
jgi:hypothetical protein